MSASGRLRRDIVANIAGRGVAGLLILGLTPVYVRRLGIEAYGLAGLAVTFKAVFSAFDLGLTTTLNREMARASTAATEPHRVRNMVRTLEIAYWCFALSVGLVGMAAAPLVVQWLHTIHLDPATVRGAVAIMAVLISVDLPFSLYAGGMLGLKRQVSYNVLNGLALTLRFGGAALIVVWVSPTIAAFLGWQCAAALVGTLAAARVFWGMLPAAEEPPAFSKEALRAVGRFTVGLGAISAMGVLIVHIDRLVLMKLVPLGDLGIYTLAATMAAVINNLIGPVFSAVFPRLSELVARGDEAGLRRQYHLGAQIMSAAVLPVWAVLAVFAPEVMLLWTGDPVVVERARWLLPLMAASAGMNAMLTIPYGLQLAYGYVRLSLATHVIAIFTVSPLVIVLTLRAGLLGAASGWALFNLASMVINMRLLHRRFLAGELGEWYRRDVGVPAVTALLVAASWRLLVPSAPGVIGSACHLAGAGVATALATAATVPFLRTWFRRRSTGMERPVGEES